MSRTVFTALSAVQADLAKQGISKDGTNTYDKYKFRGIDQVLNAMAPILAEHKVLIMPNVIGRDTQVVPTAKGGKQYHTVLTVEYTLFDEHGDYVTRTAQGEAMDRGDKSINKAMSAAYKTFLFQAFTIPIAGDDADKETHELAESAGEQVKMATAQDIATIRELIERSDTDTGMFCKFLGVEDLDKLPLDKVSTATDALWAKIKKQEGESGD